MSIIIHSWHFWLLFIYSILFLDVDHCVKNFRGSSVTFIKTVEFIYTTGGPLVPTEELFY